MHVDLDHKKVIKTMKTVKNVKREEKDERKCRHSQRINTYDEEAHTNLDNVS